MSKTNCYENHVLLSKNHANKYQEECWIRTQTDTQKTFCDTQTICDKHRGTVTKTDCVGKSQTVCDRQIMSLTDVFFL